MPLSIMALGGCRADADDALDCRTASLACSPAFECLEQDGRWSCVSADAEVVPEGAFGQPCELPESPQIQAACGGPEASCALKAFAGCDDRVCLVYQGSPPFCSVDCDSDMDCDADARCMDLFPEAPCGPDDGSGFGPECFCVLETGAGE